MILLEENPLRNEDNPLRGPSLPHYYLIVLMHVELLCTFNFQAYYKMLIQFTERFLCNTCTQIIINSISCIIKRAADIVKKYDVLKPVHFFKNIQVGREY